MQVDTDNGNTARILVLHNDIALSPQFVHGDATLYDMTITNDGSLLYILVNNGKQSKYNNNKFVEQILVIEFIFRLIHLLF